jgi:steroid delta-isomerase
MNRLADPVARAAVDLIVHTFESLTPERVAQLGAIYAPDATFKDPFNAVRGLTDIQTVFAHMYVSLESPRFVITQRIVDGAQCFLTWEFRFRFKRFHTDVDQCIVGGSHLQLDANGRITLHRDYWDAAEELYEKIPLLGGLMRWLKRKANS